MGGALNLAISLIKHYGGREELLALASEKWEEDDRWIPGSASPTPGRAITVLPRELAFFARELHGGDEVTLDDKARLLIKAMVADMYDRELVVEFAETLLAQAKALPAE